MIGILYKDVHDFAVWFHNDHDELMADLQDHNSADDSESDAAEPDTGNESGAKALVTDKETNPTGDSNQDACGGAESNQAETKNAGKTKIDQNEGEMSAVEPKSTENR